MADSLATYLKKRTERSFRYLCEQARGLTPEQALRYQDADWPDHRWGIGQNGSIAGIVYHVAAWKQITLPLLTPGGIALAREEFEGSRNAPDSMVPDPQDWPGIVVWLERVGGQWNAQLLALPEHTFDETRSWSGETVTVAKLAAEMHEHDIMHAAQLEYLRQRLTIDEKHRRT